jgi:hypothetical protein
MIGQTISHYRILERLGSDGLRQARCSPDGRYLAAVTVDGKKLRLYEFETGNWSDLSTSDMAFHNGRLIANTFTSIPALVKSWQFIGYASRTVNSNDWSICRTFAE